jgi:hypothetical protein
MIRRMSADHRLLIPPSTTVICPKCAHGFAVEEGFAKQALESLESQSEEALSVLLAEQSRRHEEALRKALAAERLDAAARAAEQYALDKAALERRVAEQGETLKALRSREVELIAEKQKLAEAREGLELEVARRLAAQREDVAARVRAQEQERTAFEKAELQKKLDDVNAKLAEAQRKAEQGSQQLQGEVLELAIEDALRRTFPLDSIEEVRKGQRGGDVIQRVVTHGGGVAGAILWETKRAKDWSPAWVAKLRDDARAAGCDLAVLVTMPSAVPREFAAGQQFGTFEDTWVTTWSSALQLAEALRAGIVEVHKQRLASANKGEKMEAVYDYLTSPQFAQKFKAVYSAFKSMQDDLARERSTSEQRWARREKQILTGMRELLGVAGDVQGLSQQSLPMLELEPAEGSTDQ